MNCPVQRHILDGNNHSSIRDLFRVTVTVMLIRIENNVAFGRAKGRGVILFCELLFPLGKDPNNTRLIHFLEG